MRDVAILLCLSVQLLVAMPAYAQTMPPAQDGVVTDAAREAEPLVRNLGGYMFPSLAATTSRMQNIAYAMRLRDYCADLRVPNAFIRVQLARFSLITGRPENCGTLLDY